ncbi:MAG: ornithine carbamoyltransferase, partial [Clostridia bacterium]|nr:ornithine carbamoyltransferase [Clostridia bacterium]
FAHPCQTLADLMTIREYKGRLDGLKVAFVGDGAHMMNSTIVGCLKSRMKVAVACPEGFDPDTEVLDFAAQVGHFEMYRDPRGAARAADVVITDSWIPEGSESEYDRRMMAFRGFTVNDDVMNYAKQDAMLLHPLPVRRGEEITGELFELHAGEIFDAVENRMHIQKAVLVELFGRERAI